MKELAREKIEKINDVLTAMPPLVFHGLFNGSLGLLYYYYHAGRALQNEALLQQAEEMLGQVFEDMNETEGGLIGAALSSGGAGLGFVANYLQQHGWIDFDTDEELFELDAYLADSALQQLDEDNTDPLHGALGILYYFTTRRQTPQINAWVNAIATKVVGKAIVTEAGHWFKNSFWKEPNHPVEVNLSLSHGLCGILVVLLKAYPFLTDPGPVEKVIREGIRFILGHETDFDLEKKHYSFFPGNYLLKDGRPERPTERLAWCYGDLNEVLLLYRAGNVLKDAAYTAMADKVGFATLARNTLPLTFNEDLQFCHGSAGLAQFYKALYQETQHPVYWDRYEHWIKTTLDLVDPCMAENKFEKSPAGLLEGWAGVGIVLCEYLADEPSEWGKVFML
jgi:lantibiotic biosynthesis protein